MINIEDFRLTPEHTREMNRRREESLARQTPEQQAQGQEILDEELRAEMRADLDAEEEGVESPEAHFTEEHFRAFLEEDDSEPEDGD